MGHRKERFVWGLVFAFSTVQYLRAEGWLLVQLTSHAGVSSWLAGALYLLQAGRGEKKKKYPLLVVQIKPSLCLFLIKQLAPRHETEEFYCWVVWKLYMGYSWGKANVWCWVSPFPKAKCISPRVRRARPAGTKSFTPALTAKRQQWIMFINQPHSSSGGSAEAKQGSGSRMRFPSLRAQNKWHRWAVALHQPQALWHMQRAQLGWLTTWGTLHRAPEEVAEPLGSQAGHLSRATLSMGQDLLWELPASLRLRAVGWERLKAAVITPNHSSLGTQCHRTHVVILSHQPLQAQELGWSPCSQCLLYFMVETHTAGISGSLVSIHSLVSFPKHFNALDRH